MVKPKQSKQTKKGVANRPTPDRARAILLNSKVILALVLILLFAFTTGLLQYSVAYIGCGKEPVIANKFAAEYSYIVPGERLYSPLSSFFSTYFCDEQSADAAGYHPRPGTELFKERTKEFLDRH